MYELGKARDCKYLPTPLAYESLSTTNTSLVRKDMQPTINSPVSHANEEEGKVEKNQGKAKKQQGQDTDPEDGMVENIPLGPGLSKHREFIERTQDRIVFEGFGWPVKYFKDLKELLTVYIHVLEGMFSKSSRQCVSG